MLNIYNAGAELPDVIPLNSAINADCLDVFDKIESASVDFILCDLPYGTTACTWDTVIEFNDYILHQDGKRTRKIGLDELLLISYKKGLSYESTLAYFEQNKIKGLWTHYKRILKPNGVVALTASQPFTTVVINSNLPWFRYNWVWDKAQGANFFNLKNRPFKTHEDVLIFAPTANFVFNPQRVDRTEYSLARYKKGIAHDESDMNYTKTTAHYGAKLNNCIKLDADGKKHPISIIQYNAVEKARYTLKHPTKKPLGLFKYLIETYTNAGALVLDNCAGSGTTAAACVELGRDFIVIEKEATYFNGTLIPRINAINDAPKLIL